MQFSHEMLLESKSVRNHQMVKYKDLTAENSLNKAKILVLATWRKKPYVTTKEVAEFYEADLKTIEKSYERHYDEFKNEVQLLTKQRLQAFVTENKSVTKNAKIRSLLIWSPRAVLRMGMLLRDSEVAKQVRNILLNVVDATGQLLKEIAEYQKEVQEAEEKIAMYERWIERVRIKDSWIRLCESTKQWVQRNPDYLVERHISLPEYLAGMCNGLYCMIWGMSKKNICDTFDIPYSDEEIIRDYAPKHHLEMLIKLEEMAIELIEVSNIEPTRAIQNAGKFIGFRVKQTYETEVKKNYKKGTEKEFVRFGFTFQKMLEKPIYLTQEVGNKKLPDLINYLERHKERRIGLLTLIADRQKQVASGEN